MMWKNCANEFVQEQRFIIFTDSRNGAHKIIHENGLSGTHSFHAGIEFVSEIKCLVLSFRCCQKIMQHTQQTMAISVLPLWRKKNNKTRTL